MNIVTQLGRNMLTFGYGIYTEIIIVTAGNDSGGKQRKYDDEQKEQIIITVNIYQNDVLTSTDKKIFIINRDMVKAEVYLDKVLTEAEKGNYKIKTTLLENK
jgi:hypothetical protein